MIEIRRNLLLIIQGLLMFGFTLNVAFPKYFGFRLRPIIATHNDTIGDEGIEPANT